LLKKPLVNNQIRAKEIRLIDENGKQIGILLLEEALRIAGERNLDLIQVTEKAEPAVCKMMDYGKYLYWLQKKEKAARAKRSGELKGVRLGFAISLHDLEIKAKLAKKFLARGQKVKIEMILRGREKGFSELAKGKIGQFLEILEKQIPIKIEGELKRWPRGFTMIISKG
jgi:translation initiation factor IF-3